MIGRHLGCLVAMLAALVATSALAETTNWPPQVRLLRTPDEGLQPQILADENGGWHLIYLKGDPAACDVFYTFRQLGRTNFEPAIRVNSIAGSAVALGTIRGAQLALGRNGRIHVAWNGSTKGKQQGEGASMYYTRMNDVGNGFESERNLMTASAGLDGGGSVAADNKGNVYVAWHGLPAGGPTGEANRVVFLAASKDDGKTFVPERIISPKGSGACGCCGLTVKVDARGNPGILYRAARNGTDRDVTLLISRDGGSSFTNRVLGPWQATTCPMSSMALRAAKTDYEWIAAWETAERINVGTVWSPRWSKDVFALDGNKQKHPITVAASDQFPRRQLIAWVEGSGWGKGGSVAWFVGDFDKGARVSGRAPGVPVWSRVAAVADPDGGFTIIY